MTKYSLIRIRSYKQLQNLIRQGLSDEELLNSMDHMLLTDEERLELIKRVREDVYMEDVILKTEAGKLLYE